MQDEERLLESRDGFADALRTRVFNKLPFDEELAPGKINFGTSGPGSMSHLVGEMFKRSAGIDIVGVPYKGGVLAVQDLMGGQVQMIFSDALPVMQHIRAGKLRPIGITSKDRSPLSPDIPTMAREGS